MLVHYILCETLLSAKQTINDKLQGSVATYLRYGGVVNKQIKKGLLLSLWVPNIHRFLFFFKGTSKGRPQHVHGYTIILTKIYCPKMFIIWI